MKNAHREEILIREAVRSILFETVIDENLIEGFTSEKQVLNEFDMQDIKNGFSALKDFFSGKLEKVATGVVEKIDKVKSDMTSNLKEPIEVSKEIIRILKEEGVKIPKNSAIDAIAKIHEMGPQFDEAAKADTAKGGSVEKQIEKIASGDETSQALAMESYRRIIRSLDESLETLDENLRVQGALKILGEAVELLGAAAAIFGWWMGLLAIVSGCYLISKGIYYLCKWTCGADAQSTKLAKTFADAFHAVEEGLKDITVPDVVSYPVYKALRKLDKFKDEPDLSFAEFTTSDSRKSIEKWLFFAILIFSLIEAVAHLSHAAEWLTKIVFGGKTAVKGTEVGMQTYQGIRAAVGSGAEAATASVSVADSAALAGEALLLSA